MSANAGFAGGLIAIVRVGVFVHPPCFESGRLAFSQ